MNLTQNDDDITMGRYDGHNQPAAMVDCPTMYGRNVVDTCTLNLRTENLCFKSHIHSIESFT